MLNQSTDVTWPICNEERRQ